MLNKCVTTKATLIVPDIEDSVPYSEKPRARQMISEKLKFIRENAFSKNVVITPRTNGPHEGALFFDDLEGIITKETVKYIDGVCIPKVDTVDDIQLICDQLSKFEKKLQLDTQLKVIPQIESTLSLVNMVDILRHDQGSKKRIIAAAFGGDDFTADFGVDRSDNDKELDFARKNFAVNCHAFGITSIDTPYVQYKNIEGLNQELEYLNSIGMKAKFAIHPTQIEHINRQFCPSQELYEYYNRMV